MMPPKRLLWQIYPMVMVIILVSLASVTWYGASVLKRSYLDQIAIDLATRARLLAQRTAESLEEGNGASLQKFCRDAGEEAAARLTIINRTGLVLCDSEKDPGVMENHANRLEVREALHGRTGTSLRYSETTYRNMMYVAVPARLRDGSPLVLRISLPVTAIDDTLRNFYLRIAFGGLIIMAAVAVFAMLISRRISRPLEEMRRGAERLARGQFDRRLPVSGSEEVAGLAAALNCMADQLHERMQVVIRQRNEKEAVLANMVEGVLVVDLEARVIDMNRSAAELFGIDCRDRCRGKSILEIIRNLELLRFVEKTLKAGGQVEGTLTLARAGAPERVLQAHGILLTDSEGLSGGLIVLHDVTRLLHLENLRRDFVANVSHELKTPITAIKGFVETLQDGAVADPDAAHRFLAVIARHTDRLHSIIEDLLSLSRIEKETKSSGIVLAVSPIAEVLKAARETCQLRATEAGITIRLDCSEDLLGAINPRLLEQAVINLLDNAIKYSGHGSEVLVTAAREQNEIGITVKDSGSGIDPEHLPRIFERFYRVDKARNRKLGGTGLGLAIVKHIAQAHGGRVAVASTPGAGSTFSIFLSVHSK